MDGCKNNHQNSFNFKSIFYADDMVFFFKNNEELNNYYKCLDLFFIISGCKINKSKSFIVSSNYTHQSNELGIIVNNKQFKYLGILFILLILLILFILRNIF